jgi:hypothetical protein
MGIAPADCSRSPMGSKLVIAWAELPESVKTAACEDEPFCRVAEGEVCLLLHHPPGVLSVLATHGPWTFSEAFAGSLDCVDLFVM